MAQQLTKKDLYVIYTENIRYANFQLEAIRRQTRQLAGNIIGIFQKIKNVKLKKTLKMN